MQKNKYVLVVEFVIMQVIINIIYEITYFSFNFYCYIFSVLLFSAKIMINFKVKHKIKMSAATHEQASFNKLIINLFACKYVCII